MVESMEKIESEIENSSGAVAVLDGEEGVLENKVVALAEEYLSFNNNEKELENGLNDMLEKINSLEKTSPASEFLKGQLCLELHDIYINSAEKEKKELAKEFLEQANDSFLKSIKDDDFEIMTKNKEGKEIIFADKAQSLAYLGDIALKDFYESDNKTDWDKNLEYYQEAVEAESDEGKKHELKIIMDIRKITHYLGDENKLKVWKTPRRIDLRGRTADFSLQYAGNKNGTINKNIDATLKPEKNKQSWSDTVVLRLDKEIADFLAEVDFEALLKDANEKGELSEKNKKILKKTIDYNTLLAEKLEEGLKNEIKNSEKFNFRKSLCLNPEKLAKFYKKIKPEDLSRILSE